MADNEPVVRESLTSLVNPQEDFKRSSSFDTAEVLIDENLTDTLTILLLDVGLPVMSGLEVLPFIKGKFAELDIIMPRYL